MQILYTIIYMHTKRAPSQTGMGAFADKNTPEAYNLYNKTFFKRQPC